MATVTPVAYEWLMPLAPWEPEGQLKMALDSLFRQTWPAVRLVLSVDGQLPDHLAEVLLDAPLPVLVLQSPCWRGTGPTLAAGLAACHCQWVLRADADDRSAPHRAQRQLSYLLDRPHISVLGAQLRESYHDNDQFTIRHVPLRDHQIIRMLSWRNPINHPTVALNRNKVLLAGSYRAALGFEDWDLWLRIHHQDGVFVNLPDILVSAEVDKSHLERRHGFKYANHELKFLLRCWREELLSGWQVLILMLSRLPWRLLPAFCLKGVMSILRIRNQANFYHQD